MARDFGRDIDGLSHASLSRSARAKVCVGLARLVEVLRDILGPWGSYTNALIFLRPRPPSIQLTP
jgi:hypothetical protein